MRRQFRLVIAALGAVGVATLLWYAWAPRSADRTLLSGYIEGDDLYLSAPLAGTVSRIDVVKGQRVVEGAALFAMDPATLTAQAGQSAARSAQARAQIETTRAQADQAGASAAAARAVESQARKDLARYLDLQHANPRAVASQQIDAARAQAQSAIAQRLAAERAAAAQADQIAAARAAVDQATAAQAETGARLGQLSARAPVAGRIEDVFFQRGEWAGANQPVVSLLADDQISIRFFVPEQDVPLYRIGRVVDFSCDGCARGLRARIDYVSPRPEFTPPVIYSRKTRDKLVFQVQARPLGGGTLSPGLPVDVEPLPGAHEARR